MAIPLRPGDAAADSRASAPTGRGARLSLRTVVETYSSNYALLLSVTTLLVLVGLVMVLSSSSVDSYNANSSFFAMFLRQGAFALVGFPVMLILSRLPVAFWRRSAWIIFAVMIGAQLLVFTPLGRAVGGNRNWVYLGGLSIQPSEALKLAMIIWLAAVLARNSARLHKLGAIIVPAFLGAGVAIGLVALGHDLGTAIIMVLIFLGCLFFARVPLRFFALLLGIAGVGVIGLAVSSPNRMARIQQWLQPDCTDYLNSCWQSVHGTWALASGGLFGVGLGNGASKWSWLPAAENDFIFAVIGEEVGLIGAIVVLLLFALLAFALVRIMVSAPDPFSKIMVGGVLVWLIGQAIVNIAVVLGLLPVLGVPLPLVSYGGSALLSGMAAIGVVLSIARANPGPRKAVR